MTGWLIYDTEGALRNEWFAERVISVSRKRGLYLELKKVDGENFFELVGEPDIALVRAINPSLRKYLCEREILTLNNFETAVTANNKWYTYLLAKELGIEVMPSVLISHAEQKFPALDTPFVLKSLDGHGGSEVFLVRNESDFFSAMSATGKDMIAQKLCSDTGIDMRVYLLGGKPISAILRRSDRDFRSNFSLGGDVCVADISREQHGVIKKLQARLDMDFVGVDFIRHEGRWVLNEIEDAVGTRMLYKCTDIDAAALYAELAVKLAKKPRNK